MNIYSVSTAVNVDAQILCNKGANLDVYETTSVTAKGLSMIITGNGGGEIGETEPFDINFEFKMTLDLKTFDKAARAFLINKSCDTISVASNAVQITLHTPSQKHLATVNNLNKLLYEAIQIAKFTGASHITEIMNHFKDGQSGFIKLLFEYLKYQHISMYDDINMSNFNTLNDLADYIDRSSNDWLVEINVFEDAHHSAFTKEFIEFTQNSNNQMLIAIKNYINEYNKHLTYKSDDLIYGYYVHFSK